MENTNQIKDWHKDQNNWKFYFFYYNPDDARLMVSKRTDWAGITFNYAHKSAWFWTVCLVFIIFGLVYFLQNKI